MKKSAILLIGIFFILLVLIIFALQACSPQEAIFTSLSNSLDDAQVIIRGRADDSEYRVPLIDEATNTFVIIDFEHHEIHNGNSYKADLNTNDLDSEGTNNALHMSFITGNSEVCIHFVVIASTTGNTDISLTEAPTDGVAGGSSLIIINRDRNSINESSAISTDDATVNFFTQDATAPTGGLEIHHWKIGATLGEEEGSVGGAVRGLEEFILRQDTQYSLRMTSTENNVRAQLTANWYEHIKEVD